MHIRIKRLRPDARIPSYAHGPSEDAGLDLCAIERTVLPPGEPVLVPTGISIELQPGYEAQIRPRSGLAFKHAITLPNAPATIDPGYRGEIRIILLNLGRQEYVVEEGDRIAQMVIAQYEPVEWVEGELGATLRGESGFGSSGR
jgi:dUTP pyrophosphatase